jgi:hypothetical protein
MLPFSREQQRLPDLKASLAVYRLVFGQPRQEDLLSHLKERDSDALSAWRLALHLVGSIDRSENVSVRHAGPNSPGINRHFHLDWHRHSPHAPVLAEEVDYAPTAIALLDVAHRQRRYLGPAQAAAEEDGNDGAVTQALRRRDVRCVQERLGLLQRQPVPRAYAHRLRTFHAGDSGR